MQLLNPQCQTELQIRGGSEDNSKITFLTLNENIRCKGEIKNLSLPFSFYPFLSGALIGCMTFVVCVELAYVRN